MWKSLASDSNREHRKNRARYFDVFLTVHFSIILVINQLETKRILFYKKLILCLYMFRAPCAHHQEFKTVLYSIWYHHTVKVAFRCTG